MTTIGPDKQLSMLVDTFLKELEDDFQAPAQSKFQDYMPKCKKGVQMMEEVRGPVKFTGGGGLFGSSQLYIFLRPV